jgi:hypothetical protein
MKHIIEGAIDGLVICIVAFGVGFFLRFGAILAERFYDG